MKKSFVYAIILLFIAVVADAASAYHVIKKIRLGGDDGWDYVTIDSPADRIYITRGTHVMVFDTVSHKVVGDIPNTPGVHGVALAPELRMGFISNGKSNTASIFDKDTLEVVRQVQTGENPDAILYESAYLHVFTFNGKSKDATVFSATTGTVLATIPLGGKPEFATTDNQGRVFVNIEDTNEIVELDSRALAVKKRYSLSPCLAPTGMAIDAGHHRVFSGCRNKMMTVMDTDSGKVTATVPIGERVDAIAYDPETGLIFSSNGDGTLTVVREYLPGLFETETVATEPGARTMALDSNTHTLYLPTAEFAPVEPLKPGEPNQRPAMVKGSFTLLVVGK